MSGKRQLTVAEKKQRGTYNVTRDREQEQTELAIAGNTSAMFTPGKEPKCPRTIKSKYCKRYWKQFTKALTSFGVLSFVDVPQAEVLMVTLEHLRTAEEKLIDTDPADPAYDVLLQRFLKLSDKFDRLSASYFVSPAARSKLRLEDLNIQKTQAELDKQSPLAAILAGRT